MTESYKNISFTLYGQSLDGAILDFRDELSVQELEIATKICSSFKNLHPGSIGEYCFYLNDLVTGFETGNICCECKSYAWEFVEQFGKKFFICTRCFIEYNIICVKSLVFRIIDAIQQYEKNGHSCGSED